MIEMDLWFYKIKTFNMINISIEQNKDLYLANIESVKKALEVASSLSSEKSPEDIVDINFYWRVPRDFGRKQLLPILSCINQNDLGKCNVNLWSNVDLSGNQYLKSILPYINLKIFDINKEIKNTCLEKFKFASRDDEKCWLGGDLFRLLILHKYGGFYLDMDTVCLRDLSPLFANEFMYQWGSSGTHKSEPDIRSNGAIMRLFRNSQLSKDLLQELSKTPADPNSTCWGTDLYFKVWRKNSNWSIFPCAWFNTEWVLGIPLEPMKKNQSGNNSSELYEGAFTWHWHNRWEEDIQEGSKFQILENINYNIFRDKFKREVI